MIRARRAAPCITLSAVLSGIVLLSSTPLSARSNASSRIVEKPQTDQTQTEPHSDGSSALSQYDPAQLQPAPALRSKIAPDLSLTLADAESIDAGLSGLFRVRAPKQERINVIIQTRGRPDSVLLETLSERLRAAREEPGQRLNLKMGNRAPHVFDSINGFTAFLTPDEIHELAARGDVSYVSPDRVTHSMVAEGTLAETTGIKNILASNPYLTGGNVTMAFLDSGIDWNNPMFSDSAGGTRVRVVVDAVSGESTYSDLYGHGSAVAGVAAGRTYRSISGIASAVGLISVRVLNSRGEGSVSDAIRGLDWCLSNKTNYNIRVINMSIGASSVDSFTVDPLCQAVERVVAGGITVVAAAGNSGRDAAGNSVYGSITAPGNDPLVITVGSANTRGTPERDDDVINTFSSRGPTLGFKLDSSGKKRYDYVMKPDLVAPGNQVITARAYNCRLITEHPELYYSGSSYQMFLSGSSVASGVVAGAAAVLLDANSGLTPGLIKAILQYTAQPLDNANVFEQGAGLINIDAAIRLAVRLKNPTYLDPGDWLATTSSLPSLVTYIAGSRCDISGVVFANACHMWAGEQLFLRYQMLYRPGALWYGATVKVDRRLLTSGTVLTSGVKNVTNAILNNRMQVDYGALQGGVALVNNAVILDGVTTVPGVLLNEGIVLAEAENLREGLALGEGIVLAEGVMSPSVGASIAVGES